MRKVRVRRKKGREGGEGAEWRLMREGTRAEGVRSTPKSVRSHVVEKKGKDREEEKRE